MIDRRSDKRIEKPLHLMSCMHVTTLAGFFDSQFEPVSGMFEFVGFGERLPELLIGRYALVRTVGDQGLETLATFSRVPFPKTLHRKTITQEIVTRVLSQTRFESQPFRTFLGHLRT